MRNTVAIMQRELLSLFFSPIGYIVIAGFLVLTGLFGNIFVALAPGKPASLRDILVLTPYLLSVFIPAITMRTLSEEYRTGTIETLMTAPVSDVQVVVGKYLAALVFYLVMLAGTLVYPAVLLAFGRPDLGAAAATYLGLLLIGACFTAFGTLASALTRNQIVAWIVGTVPLILFVWFASAIVGQVEGWQRDALQRINIMGRFDQFARGLVSTDSIVFFLGTTLLFLFASVKIVETRRWR